MAEDEKRDQIVPGVSNPNIVDAAIQRVEADPDVQKAVRNLEALAKVANADYWWTTGRMRAGADMVERVRQGQASDADVPESSRLVIAADYATKQIDKAVARAIEKENLTGDLVQSSILPAISKNLFGQGVHDMEDRSTVGQVKTTLHIGQSAMALGTAIQDATAEDRAIVAQLERDAIKALQTPKVAQPADGKTRSSVQTP
jgi:hypothetical protein